MKQQKGNKKFLQQRSSNFSLCSYINQQMILDKKIISIPLQFQFLPVEILSKQFTKLNNQNKFRIHYLGPRYKNTIEMHKKNAYSQLKPFVYNSHLFGFHNLQRNCENYHKNNLNLMERSKTNSNKSKKQENNQNHNNNFLNIQDQIENVYQQKQKQQNNRMQQKNPHIFQSQQSKNHQFQRYKIDHLKIYFSYILQQKLKSTEYFKSSNFYRAFQGMNPSLNLQEEYVFNSCFQSGNLDCVIKISKRQFDLFLRIDSNTRGHLLWFYFSVKNGKKIGNLIMNICNFSKSKTLYKQGLKPYIFSTKKYAEENIGWQQNGSNLGMQKKQLRYDILGTKNNLPNINCLTIQYDFQYQNDEVFFAYCIPYTYSQLCIEIQQLPSKYVTKTYLGKSLLGTPIPLLHITGNQQNNTISKPLSPLYQQENTFISASTKNGFENNSTTVNFNSQQMQTQCEYNNNNNKMKNQKILNKDQQKQNKIKKKIIFITGRIHPSQSNSSYVLMGFIKWLCSQQKQAIQIRKIARFIIIPMVNPDGVILGNSRTSASGKDLNRQYINPDPSLYPQIHLIRQLATNIHQDHEINLFLDFHGHSRKKNTFFYGPVYSISEPNYYKCRILPKLIQKISNSFRYHSCSFNLIQDKKRTARALMFQFLNIPFTYTVESSIGYYYDCQKLKLFQFNQFQWAKIGKSIAQGTVLFMIGMSQYQNILEEKRKSRYNKKKYQKMVINTKNQYVQDQFYFQNIKDQPLKIIYEEKGLKKSKQQQKNYFIQMLNQLRTAPVQKQSKLRYSMNKQIDNDEQSDSHDQKQDIQIKILNQFKFVIKNQNSQQINQKINRNTTQIYNNHNIIKKPKKSFNNFNDQFQFFKNYESKGNYGVRVVKTVEGKRNYENNKEFSRSKIELEQYQYKIQQNSRQNTIPNQNTENHDNYQKKKIIRNFVTNKIPRRSQVYTSQKVQRRVLLNQSTQKQQKTIPNYFGQFHLCISEQNQGQQKKNKDKVDFIKKLHYKKDRIKRSRAQSSNDMRHRSSFKSQNNIANLYLKNKKQKTNQIIHAPTQFTLSLPYSQYEQSISKTSNLKPKLKPNIRSKPHSIPISLNFNINPREKQQIFNMKQIKQMSQKIIQNVHIVNKRQSIKNTTFTSILNKNMFKSEKNTARDLQVKSKQKQTSKICTKIDLNNQVINGVSNYNSNKKIFQF